MSTVVVFGEGQASGASVQTALVHGGRDDVTETTFIARLPFCRPQIVDWHLPGVHVRPSARVRSGLPSRAPAIRSPIDLLAVAQATPK